MDALLLQYPWLDELLMGFLGLSWKHVVMWIISGLLIYLAVRKGYEEMLATDPDSKGKGSLEGPIKYVFNEW